MTLEIVCDVYDESDLASKVGSFTTALEAAGENIANAVAQNNYIIVAESDSAALAILNDGGNAIDKYICAYQDDPLNGGNVRITNFICKEISLEIAKDSGGGSKRVVRIKGPNKFYELTNRTLGNTLIAHRDTGTISASALDVSNCRIIPGDADYKSDDYYNGWALTTDDGYVAIVETYLTATGHCSLAGNWEPDDGTTPSAGANYELKSGITTEDVTQVMEFAPSGWSATYPSAPLTGTTDGTSFVAAGENVMEGLKTIAKLSGEVFVDHDSITVNRTVAWHHTPVSTAGTFRNDITQANYEAGLYDPILSLKRRRVENDRVTRLTPYGNNNLTIKLAETEVSVPAGFSVDWDNNLITNTSAESGGAMIRYSEQIWPEIQVIANDALPATEQVPETAAAVALFNAAIIWLTSKSTVRYEIVLETHPNGILYPGKYYDIDYNGEVTVTLTAFAYRVRDHVGEDGYRKTTLYFSTDHYEEPIVNGGHIVAQALKNFKTWAAHNTGGAGLFLGSSGGGGGGDLGGGGDHTHDTYLPLAGGNLTGNVTADALVTIDGVDIGVHAADASAHHDPVTAGTHISLSGQEVSVTATSDGDTNPSTVIASDANGRARLDGLGLNTAVTGAGLQLADTIAFTSTGSITTGANALWVQPDNNKVVIVNDLELYTAGTITTNSGDLTLNPAGDVILSPTGGQVYLPDSKDIEAQNWTSGFLGSRWGIDTELGHIDARSAYFDELRVTLFSADETLVTAGTHWVTPGMATVSQDFVIPAVSATGTLYLRDSAALADTAVFRENDWVMIRVKDTTGGGLTIANVWGQVDSYSDETGGEQSWTFTTRSLGAAVGGNTIPAESVALGFGQSGDGWWSVTTNDLTSGPYAQISTWSGSDPYTAANRTQHVRIGDLNGIAGLGHQYGLYAGVSPTGPRIIASDTQVSFHQVPLTMYTGTSDSGQLRIYALELNSDVETAIEPNNDLTNDGVTRSSGSGNYYTHINENPASGQPDSQWLYNTSELGGYAWFGLEDISHTLTELSIEAYVTSSSFVDDTAIVMVQVFKQNGVTELTDELRLFSNSTEDGLVSIDFTGVDTTATDAAWAAARLKITWLYYVAGETETVRLTPDDGLHITSAGDDYEDFSIPAGRYGSVTLGGTVTDPKAWLTLGTPSSEPYLRVGVKNTDAALTSYLRISNENSDNSDSVAITLSQTEAGNPTNDKLQILFDEVEQVRVTTDGLGVYGGYLYTNTYLQTGQHAIIADGLGVGDGIYVGNAGAYATPDTGQLILDQGAGDGVIFKAVSSDFDNYSSQGMDSAGTYLQIKKAESSIGGAKIKAGSDGIYSMWIVGSANTGTSTLNTSAVAPLILEGQVDDDAVGAGNNAVVMRSGNYTRWILQGDGDTYQDGDMYDAQNFTPDFLDDVMAVRASMIATGNAVITEHDNDVPYTRDDLEELGIIKGQHRNRSKLSELHSGSIWEIHKRLLAIEAKLS